MKNNFLKFKKEKKFKKEDFDLKIDFYWKILLYVSLLFILGTFVFGYFLFIKINKEPPMPEPKVNIQAEKVKKERIEKVLNYFLEKEERANIILNSPSTAVDPSL